MNSFTISTSPSGQGRTARNRQKRQRRRARRRQQLTTAAPSTMTVSLQQPANQAGPRRRNRRGRRQGVQTAGLSPVSRFYLGSVLDPCGPPGAKVPDVTSSRTGTARLVYRSTVPIPGTGVAFLIAPYIYNGIGRFNEQDNPQASMTNFPSADSFAGAFEKYRPVSMCLDMEFTGTTMSDAGMFFGNQVPSNWDPTGISMDNFANNVDNVLVPVRHGGVRVTWSPEDNSDFEFIESSAGKAATIVPFINAQFEISDTDWTNVYPTTWQFHHGTQNDPSHLSARGSNFPCLIGGVTGASEGATMVIQVTLNVECIPKVGVSSFVSTAPSPSDPVGLAKVSTIVENLPHVAAGVAAIGGAASAAAYQVWGQGSSARSYPGYNPSIGVPPSLYSGGYGRV